MPQVPDGMRSRATIHGPRTDPDRGSGRPYGAGVAGSPRRAPDRDIPLVGDDGTTIRRHARYTQHPFRAGRLLRSTL